MEPAVAPALDFWASLWRLGELENRKLSFISQKKMSAAKKKTMAVLPR